MNHIPEQPYESILILAPEMEAEAAHAKFASRALHEFDYARPEIISSPRRRPLMV